jgi:glucan 1,3-beta-glucosidase
MLISPLTQRKISLYLNTNRLERNVKDFGAKGDGKTDDTAAINEAISSGNRCAPGQCGSSSTTPAVVYFPAGTYIVSGSIIDYYYTQMIGNPNCMPVIKASSGFNSRWVIDGNPVRHRPMDRKVFANTT